MSRERNLIMLDFSVVYSSPNSSLETRIARKVMIMLHNISSYLSVPDNSE